MYSYGPPHMAVQKQDGQHEHTFSSYVRIRDVVLKTYLGRWTIGRSGERGSGISVLPAQDDDDDDIYISISLSPLLLFLFSFLFLSFLYLLSYNVALCKFGRIMTRSDFEKIFKVRKYKNNWWKIIQKITFCITF